MSAIGEFIRRQRELNELSMKQLASMVGISNPYLSQIERGLREPSDKVLQGIARSFDLSVESLYERAGAAPPPEERDTERAIRADPYLRPRQRQALLEVYAAFRAQAKEDEARG